jgi:uncharacterized membrane protein YgdD (TMEM256/DUF423 family)
MTTIFLVAVALSLVAGVMAKSTLNPSMIRIKQKACSHQVIPALALLTILVPGFANAHGNVAIEEDSCVRRVGGSLVHFNAYQPQYE